MAKSGNRGVGLLIGIMIVAALVYRFWPGRSAKHEPAPDAAIAVDAASKVVTPDAATPEIPAPEEVEPPVGLSPDGYLIEAIATAGDKVLLSRNARSPGEVPSYRLVTIATGAVEAAVELPAHKFIGVDDPDPVVPTMADKIADAEKMLPLLRSLPLGAAETFAVSPDGTRAAFNDGDHLYLLHEGKATKLAFPAAYAPGFLPDGKTLLFRGYDGEYDGPGTGRYSLFSMPVEGGKAQKIAGTEGAGLWALSADGRALRTFVADSKYVATCLIEIPLVKPFKVGRKRCIDAVDASVELSRGGDFVAWMTPLGTATPATFGTKRDVHFRLRVLELERGGVPFDHLTNGDVLIGDRGRVLVEAEDRFYDIDGATVREIKSLRRSTIGCSFYSDSAIVCPTGESIETFDIAKR
jgi:hypothetical protein